MTGIRLAALLAGALAGGNAIADGCDADAVELEVLGSGGPEYDDGRRSASYVVYVDGRARVLIDAGPGAADAFGDAGARYEDLDTILLTHLHVDHAAGLPAFVKGGFFSDRERELVIYGPAGNERMPATTAYVDRLFGRDGAYRYLGDYVDPESSAPYRLRAVDVPLATKELHRFELSEDIDARAIAVHHGPIAAVAWRIETRGCSIAFSGDMSGKSDGFPTLADGADLVVMHNAVPEDAEASAANLHMRPSEIGEFAAGADVKAVVLSHLMKRTLDRQDETMEEIRKAYDGPLRFAEDGERLRP